MASQDELEKIILAARIDEEQAFLNNARDLLGTWAESHHFHDGVERKKILRLIDRMLNGEMEFLESEPETYLELYGE